MINSVRNTVLSVLNKNNYGFLSPSDFNLFAKQAQMEIFTEVFEEYNKAINKENARTSGSDYADMSQAIEECIDTFSKTVTLSNIGNNLFDAPQGATGYDYYKINNVLVNGRIAERVSHTVAYNMLAGGFISPTLNYPIYTHEGNTLTLYPESIDNTFIVRSQYIRNPKAPKWTYATLVNGEPMFNQSATDYQDFELPEDYEYYLVQKILQYAGISIREIPVYQYAKGEEQEQQR